MAEQYPPLDQLLTYEEHFDERGVQRFSLWTTRTEAATRLREQLADAIGESGACSDRDCSCHRHPERIRETMDELGITEEETTT